MGRRALVIGADEAWARALRGSGVRALVASTVDEAEGAPADVVVVTSPEGGDVVRAAWRAWGRREPVLVAGEDGGPEDVAARVEAALAGRRPSGRLALGDALVDLDRETVVRGGREIPLTTTETSLLTALASADVAWSREALLRDVWGWRATSATRAVDNAVARLRDKIEADPAAPRWLLTERGVGYRLAGVRREVADPEPTIAASPVPIGRDADVAAVLAALAEGASLVTVCGPPGIGRSSVLRSVAAAMALHADALPAPADVLAAGGTPIRVDGADEGTGVATWLEAAWAASPRARFVVAARSPLRSRRERLVRLGPLSPEDAARALVDGARAIGEPLPEDVARRLATSLGGWPAALAEAVARLRVVGADGWAERADRPHGWLPRAVGAIRADLAAHPDVAEALASVLAGTGDDEARRRVAEAGYERAEWLRAVVPT